MSKPAVIVTGSSGLIGAAVCNRLAGKYRVFGFDRPGAPHPPDTALNVPVDLLDDDSVAQGVKVVRGNEYDRVESVIHLAAYYDFSGEESPLYDTLTVGGTRRLIHALRELPSQQFIFSSTMLVHAQGEPGLKIDENSPIEPTWAYPKSKVETEALIKRERGDMSSLILRIAGVYDDWCHSIPIAHQIARIDQDELTSRVYPGSTSHGQAFVHNEDVVEAIALAVDRRMELPPDLPLLIGEDFTLSYDELQHTIARLLKGESFETHRVPKTIAKLGAWVQDVLPGSDPFIKAWMINRATDHYELDISQARQHLGWTPRRSLRQTLPLMIEHLQASPLKWYEENGMDPPKDIETRHPRAKSHA